MPKTIIRFATRPLRLNRKQRRMVSGVLLAGAGFAAKAAADLLYAEPLLPILPIGILLLGAAALTILAVLALRGPKNEKEQADACDYRAHGSSLIAAPRPSTKAYRC